MPERHLLPIPLPGGRTGDTGHLTVYFSPRLREAGDLSDYRDWLNWADTVRRRLKLAVIVDGVEQRNPPQVSPPADPLVWEATFAQSTPVKAHRRTDWTATPMQ